MSAPVGSKRKHSEPSVSKSGSGAPSASGGAKKSKAKEGGKAKPSAGVGTAIDVDIDAIFAGIASTKAKARVDAAKADEAAKRKETASAKAAAEVAATIARLEKEGLKTNRIKAADSPVASRVDPDSGLPIYTSDQLKLGQGGGTALCPFDCDCCFG